jgi:hypothetical protein
MLPRVLLVDPRRQFVQRLQDGWSVLATIEACTDFPAARATLLKQPPELLVTNLRLGAYNGIHLVYLSGLLNKGVRSIVYSERPDPWILREVRSLGAFYENASALPVSLRSYLGNPLPPVDRRDGEAGDRRRVYRGGRRSVDAIVPKRPILQVGELRDEGEGV